jgi:NADH-quinone oxidoreductase subunit J
MINAVFYVAAGVGVISTLMVITRLNAVHALIYLIISLLAVAVIFYTLGAPFAAALEIIVYAGAIMVLFVFVVMMLNLGPATLDQERRWVRPKLWLGPSLLVIVLLAELIYMIGHMQSAVGAKVVGSKQLGITLFGPYLLGVELASMLLLAGLVGAYRLGMHTTPLPPQKGQ